MSTWMIFSIGYFFCEFLGSDRYNSKGIGFVIGTLITGEVMAMGDLISELRVSLYVCIMLAVAVNMFVIGRRIRAGKSLLEGFGGQIKEGGELRSVLVSTIAFFVYTLYAGYLDYGPEAYDSATVYFPRILSAFVLDTTFPVGNIGVVDVTEMMPSAIVSLNAGVYILGGLSAIKATAALVVAGVTESVAVSGMNRKEGWLYLLLYSVTSQIYDGYFLIRRSGLVNKS